MSLILALIAHASAGTLLALDPTLTVEPLPRESVVPLDAIVPDVRYTAVDAHATRQLGEELLAVRPLMHKFDGEIEIMSRLDAAADEVRVVRDLQERRLLYQTLAFEGFAVQRYFQEGLGTEPAAEAYRVLVGDQVEVKAWVDAIALDPYHEPIQTDVSEEPELSEFQATRDRLLFSAPALVFVDAVPPGASVVLDGQMQISDPAAGYRVYPGRHRLIVLSAATVVQRDDFTIGPGELRHVTVPPSKKELDDLIAALREAPDRVTLTEPLFRAISALEDPVRVSAAGPDGLPRTYAVESDELIRIDPAGDDSRQVDALLRLRLGAGVVHDPAYQTGAAPDTFGTRMGAGPLLGVEASWSLAWPVAHVDSMGIAGLPPSRPPLVLALGVDVLAPGGEFHDVPLGDRRVRLRYEPYVAFGIPQVQLALGAVFPWYASVGLRGSLPLIASSKLDLALNQGVVAFRSDRPAQESAPTTACIAVSTTFGK